MAEAVLAISTAEVTKKATVVGSSFGTGMVLGWVARTRPTWATVSSLGLGGVGIMGSLIAKGGVGEMFLGVGSAAMGALGASIPALFAGPAKRAPEKIAGDGRKLLAAPTNVVAEAIAGNVRSAVEF